MGWVVRLAAIVGTVASTWVAPAAAQEVPETGGRVFGLAGGSFGDGGTTVMTGGGAGLRMTRRLGIDFELLYLPNLEAEAQVISQTARLAPRPAFDVEHDADLTTFLTKFTVDFPVTGDRLFPYVTGGGIAHLAERLRIRFNGDRPRPLQEFDVIRPRIFPPPQFDVSETGLALTHDGRGSRCPAVAGDERGHRCPAVTGVEQPNGSRCGDGGGESELSVLTLGSPACWVGAPKGCAFHPGGLHRLHSFPHLLLISQFP